MTPNRLIDTLTGNAFVDKSESGLGFRCQDGTTEIVYRTPEEADDSKASSFNGLDPKLKLRIDSNPIVDLEVNFDSNNGKLRGVADVDMDLLTQVRDAKRRVAVAIEVLDKLYHEQSLDVAGSTEALKRLILNCASIGQAE